jgi:phytoene dehydrogenase-like protein
MSLYDLIIVGGGISGLRVGIESLKLNPHIKCCILEKYGYIGGRIVTFRKDIPKVGPVQWENGAGRISNKHTKLLKLLNKYNLTFIPNDGNTDFILESNSIISKNKFTDLIKFYLEPISKLPPDTLGNHTLKELLDKIVGPTKAKSFYEQFPYYSEIHVLRADLALQSFQNEMKSNEGFGSCKEGLSSITDSMMKEFTNFGGKIFMDTELIKVINLSNNFIQLDCKIRNTKESITYTGKSVVLALHHAALKDIKGIKLNVLKHLTMTPLLRIYAIFPTKGGVSWFSNLNKIVTDSPIRYIIPIDAKRGIVMISYTDGRDAKYWIKQDNSTRHGEDIVQDLVMTEIKKLFPERAIPKPIFFKQHQWHDGCTYWLPGSYDVIEESRKSLNPKPDSFPNLFMCGESFAVHQCWMESALEQADKLLDNKQFLYQIT